MQVEGKGSRMEPQQQGNMRNIEERVGTRYIVKSCQDLSSPGSEVHCVTKLSKSLGCNQVVPDCMD